MILKNQLEQIIEGQTAWTTAKRKEIARDTTEATEAIEGFAGDSADLRLFADFIRHTDRGIMPGDPKLIALVHHHDADDCQEEI